MLGCIEGAGNCDTGQSHLKVQHIPLDARQHGPVEPGLLVEEKSRLYYKSWFCQDILLQGCGRPGHQHSTVGMKYPCSRTLLVRLGLFRRSGCLCPNLFSTDNLAKSGFPGEILSHGSLFPCPSQSLVGLKEASLEAHLLELHQACAPHLSPGFSKHLFQTPPDALCSGSATGSLCVCSKAGASQPGAQPGVALLLPSPSPCCEDFWLFFPS